MLDTDVDKLFIGSYETSKIENQIGEKSYVMMIEDNSYSLQVVNKGYVRPSIVEINTSLMTDGMYGATNWHFTKEYNYALLNTSKIVNKAVAEYEVKPAIEYKVVNDSNTRLVEIGRLAVDDLSYMINSNTTFSLTQSIFEDEESELFEFWIEDIII